jgi:hypothetical protein
MANNQGNKPGQSGSSGAQGTSGSNQSAGTQGGYSAQDSDYWRQNYQNEPYYKNQYSFDDYEPAYRYGTEGRSRYSGQSWDQAKGSMESDWQSNRGNSRMDWNDASSAARSAWTRSDRSSMGGGSTSPGGMNTGSGDRNTASGSSTGDLDK